MDIELEFPTTRSGPYLIVTISSLNCGRSWSYLKGVVVDYLQKSVSDCITPARVCMSSTVTFVLDMSSTYASVDLCSRVVGYFVIELHRAVTQQNQPLDLYDMYFWTRRKGLPGRLATIGKCSDEELWTDVGQRYDR